MDESALQAGSNYPPMMAFMGASPINPRDSRGRKMTECHYSIWKGGPDWKIPDYISTVRAHVKVAKSLIKELEHPNEHYVVVAIEIHRKLKVENDD